MATVGQRDVQPQFDGGDPLIVEPFGVCPGEVVISELGESRTFPECQSFIDQRRGAIIVAGLEGLACRGHRRLELLRVGGDSVGIEPIAGFRGDQILRMGYVALDDLAQLRDLILQRVGREIIASAGLDELIYRRYASEPEGEIRQHDALLPAPERPRTKVGAYLQRPEYSHQHRAILPRGRNR